MKFTGFIGPAYSLDSKNVDAQRCVNMYLKINESGKGKEGDILSYLGTPGLTTLLTLGTSPTRGSFRGSDGFLYMVAGNKAYRISSTWVATEIGELLTSTGNVDFADNGVTLIIVDGPNGYSHTLTSTIMSAMSDDADWKGASHVWYIDGYFLFNKPDSAIFYITDANAITLPTLDFSTVDGAPDDIISVLINHREVWFFGDDSIEGWYNSGNADFPFERIGGGFMEMGCAAAFSPAKSDKTTLWLGKNKEGHGVVYAARGFDAQRVSTHAIEFAMQGYSDISDAKAYTYQSNGHSFYVLNFPTGDATWVYDLSTGMWHERGFWDGKLHRHRGHCHAFAHGTHIVGDWENGKVYKLDQDAYDDAGDEILRLRSAPHLSKENVRIVYHGLRVDMETGVGLTGSQQGDDPKCMLRWSDDGGHTWSNIRDASVGKIGKYETRALFRRMGQSRDRIFEWSMTDPVKCALIGVELDLEPLAS